MDSWDFLDEEEQVNMFRALEAYYSFNDTATPEDTLVAMLEDCANKAKDKTARDMLDFWVFEVSSRNKVRKRDAR